MVPDKFNMVDMGGIDLIMMQGEEVPGLYNRLVESIAQCRYQCLYNWLFDGVIIPPTYVELEVNENDEVAINEGVTISEDDVIHIYSIQPPAPGPEIIPLLAEENGVYNAPTGKDGFNPVTVDVPSYTPIITPITITANGTYQIPVGIDGYGPITVNVEGGTSMDYSLNEITIGTWIDGKPLYQKVVTFNNVLLGNAPANKVPHGISDIEFAFMYDLFFMDTNNSLYANTYGNAIGGTRGANSIYQSMWVVDSTGFWSTASDVFNAQSTRSFIAVIRYTKTTDNI